MVLLRNFLAIFYFFSSLYASDYIITDYRNKFDLASQRILDGVQGPLGKVYFLTARHILVYDGKNFELLKNISSTRLLHRKMEADNDSSIWFFSYNEQKELIKYDGENFSSILIPEEVESIKAFAVNNDKIFFAALNDEIYSFRNNSWQKFKLPEFFSGSLVTDLEIIDEQLWVSTDSGVFAYDNFLLQSGRVITTLPTYDLFLNKSESTLFFLMDNYLGISNDNSFKEIRTGIPVTSQKLSTTYINMISENELIIGTAFSHHILDTRNWKHKVLNKVYDINLELSSFTFRDSYNNTWICTELGLIRINKPIFNTYTEKDGLLDNVVSAISQFDNGDILAGHKKGITLLKEKSFVRIPLSGQDGNELSHVIDLIIDNKQRAWFLIQGRGIGRIDDISKQRKIKWFENEHFQTMTLLESGEVFVASRIGFYKIKENNIAKLNHLPVDGSFYFRRVLQKNDTILAATSRKGLIYFNLETNDITEFNTDLTQLYSIAEHEYNLLAGTNKGLFELRQKDYREILLTENPHKPVEVYFINNTNTEAGLWIGTNIGLFQLSSDKIRYFNTSDGLADNELYRSAFLFDSNKGKIWVGTIGGLSSINLNAITGLTEKPELILKNNNHINVNSDLLPNVANSELFLNFYTVCLYPEPEIKYRIKIEGESTSYSDSIITFYESINVSDLKDDIYNVSITAIDRFANESDEITIKYKVENAETNAKIILAILILSVLLLASFIIMRRKSPVKSNQKITVQDSEIIQPDHNIRIFGPFSIINKKGENITHKLTPKLKEIFLILMVYSIDKRNTINGLSSEKLSDFVWSDADEGSIKNKRNLAIRRLRELLENEELGEIEFDNKRWRLQLDKKLGVDYIKWMNLRRKIIDNSELSENELDSFFRIVSKGKFLSDCNYDWLDDIKVWHNRESVKLLGRILHDTNKSLDFRQTAGTILTSIDPLSELDVIYFLKFLRDSNRLSLAAEVYQKFNNEYRKLFGADYKLELQEIIMKKSAKS